MSKKKNLKDEVLISENTETQDAVVVTDESEVKPAKKADKKSDKKADAKGKDAKKKNKDKEGLGKKVRRKTRETVSELKKVTWPTFGDVCKKTGVVLSFVLLFAIVLFGLDALLWYLFGLLT